MRHRNAAWVIAVGLAGGVAAAQPAPDPPAPAPDVPASKVETPTPPPEPPKPSEIPKPPVPPPDLPPPGFARDPVAIAGYDHGLFVATRDDAFHLGIGVWLQTRWEIGNDGGVVDERFSIPVGRIILAGHAFATTDMMLSGEAGQGTFVLRDAYIDQPVPFGHLRVGQFKPYFSQQQLVEPVYLEFTDHPITFGFAGIDRDIGASLHDEPVFGDSGIAWAIGVFDGTGITPTQPCTTTISPIDMLPIVTCLPPTNVPVDEQPLAVARVGWNSARIDPYREGDLSHGRPRFAVGLGYAGDLARGEVRQMTHTITADAMVKAYGLAITTAVFVQSTRTTMGRDAALAWHAQVGYTFVPNLIELAGRFAQIPNGNVHEQQMLGVLNIFRRGHDLKVQIEGGGLRLTGSRAFDWVTRLQTQLLF